MPVALAPAGVSPSPSSTGFGTLSGSLTTGPNGQPMYQGVPLSSLPAGNQAAILAGQQSGQGATTAPTTLAPTVNAPPGATGGGATGEVGKMDQGLTIPPANDFVNAGITAAGTVAPLGTGFLASVVKGLYQQMTSGDEANTNNMSLVDRAIYGPGFGEQFVSWLSDLFGFTGGEPGTAFDATPGAQVTTSFLGGDVGAGNTAGPAGPGTSLSSSLSDPGSLGSIDPGSITGDFGSSQSGKGGM